MGAYTCQYGVVHKTCRCPTPHTIVCDVPSEHGNVEKEPEVKTFYISIQTLDYDDYPIGMETRLGPFASKQEAVDFMTNSDKFVETRYTESYSSWALANRGRRSVNVKNLLDMRMITPEDYR